MTIHCYAVSNEPRIPPHLIPDSGKISGSWRDAKQDVATSDAVTFTYKTSGGDTLSMTTPTGQSYTAKLDGKEVPFVGDPGVTTVSRSESATLSKRRTSVMASQYRSAK